MEITEKQFNTIKERYSKGEPLEEIMLNSFPSKDILLVRGYGPAYINHLEKYEGHTRAAYFSLKQAEEYAVKSRKDSEKAMENFPVQVGLRSDYIFKYHVMKTNAKELGKAVKNEQEKKKDYPYKPKRIREVMDKNKIILDSFDAMMIFQSLRERLVD